MGRLGSSPSSVSRWPLRLGLALVLATTGTWSSSAWAEPVVEVEARGELLPSVVSGGPTLELGLGYALDTYPLLLVPEVVIHGGYDASDVGLFRAMGGARVGLTTLVEPSIYLHGGYGLLGSSGGLAHGAALDTGLSVDKRIGRSLTLGGSLGYQGFFGGGAELHGIVLGAHVGFWIGS